MRALLALTLAVLATPVTAQSTDAELRALALAGDTAAVEAAFDAAQGRIAAAIATHDDLRNMTLALTVTNPRIEAFAEAWLAAEPGSAHAHAVRAFQLYHEGARGRGTASGRETHEFAHAAFADRNDRAMELALEGAALDPAHAPTTDAVFLLQHTTRALPSWDYEARVEATLRATHDAGSLARALIVTLPQWGGGGPVELARLCDRYAPLVEVESYDMAACFAHAAFLLPFGDDVRYAAAETVMSGPDAIFEPFRTQAAILRSDLMAPEELAARVREPSFTDVELAQDYDLFVGRPRGEAPIYYDVVARARDEARAILAYDPFNVQAIDTVLGGNSLQGTPAARNRAGPEERARLARARVQAAPFDPVSWQELSSSRPMGGWSPVPLDPIAEIADGNAVAYSNHASHRILSYLHGRHILFTNAEEWLATGDITPDQHAAALDAVLCPITRADRLIRAVCEGGAGGFGCQRVNFAQVDWQDALDLVEEGGLCRWERHAPVASLAFSPRPLPQE